ncbi:MAG TPA: hypothetical protein VM554_12955 [Acidisarcina sp.]|nr:hypothetical protein [Acidisarcina sp.]
MARAATRDYSPKAAAERQLFARYAPRVIEALHDTREIEQVLLILLEIARNEMWP